MEFKHFSHIHELIPHQVPQETQIICSGCNSPGSGSIYVCWPCRFFLHEQCFKATRFMKHSSHPIHPLNLIPYPTYPSNSFFCNSCTLVGNGFAYSCSECEFDLHVQCAYMSNTTTNESHEPVNNKPVNLSNSNEDQVKVEDLKRPKEDLKPLFSKWNVRNYPEKIEHKSHPNHPLKLLKSAPYKGGEFLCNACARYGTSFVYHCKTCQFEIHADCASLPETMKRQEHKHPLKLYYCSPYKNGGDLYCDVCYKSEYKSCWAYYCKKCEFATHARCKEVVEEEDEENDEDEEVEEEKEDDDEDEEEEEEEEEGKGKGKEKGAKTLAEALIDSQMQMQRNMFQMQMARQNAQFMASLGHSLANI